VRGDLIRITSGNSNAALGAAALAVFVTSPALANGRVQPNVSAPALQSVSDSIVADKRGFGDDQFNRFVSSSRAQPARVPSLAAIYESSAPTRPRAFGDGALPLAEAPKALAEIPSDTSSLLLGLTGAVAPAGMPLRNARLTSQFGLRSHPILGGMRIHSGVDLAAPIATPIRATADGVVTRASWAGGYGLLVSIQHKDGVVTRYGHMSRLAVEPGQRVAQNAVIGYVGSTGRSTGPHLHYEVLVKGRAVDPLRAKRP
jgi:murein DD-endopeptidase MepM/ murein hydrolase activator NlpD